MLQLFSDSSQKNLSQNNKYISDLFYLLGLVQIRGNLNVYMSHNLFFNYIDLRYRYIM
jgi:hypothetical protein